MYSAEEIKAAKLDDFRVFLLQVWDFLRLPKPTPVQNDIAHWLQHGPRRLIIEAFRGVGKSWITAAFVCWILLNDPEAKVLVVSASKETATLNSAFIKQLIHGMPLLQHLAPRRESGHPDQSIMFTVGPARESKDPSVKSAGITGQITGSRADYIVADDVEIPKNSYTHLLRERLSELVKEFDSILKPGGRVIYLGTPQTEASLYNRLLDRGYEMRVWPVQVPERPDIYHGRLSPFVVRRIEAGWAAGTPLDPDRFDEQDILERRASYGESGFALQFMLDTNPSDVGKHPLRTKDLIIDELDPERGHVKLMWTSDSERRLNDLHSLGFEGDYYSRAGWKSDEVSNFHGTVMAIDPSGRGEDETAYAIVRFLHGMLYAVDIDGFKDGFSEETLKMLAIRAVRHRVNYIIDEPNYGGGMFRQLLKPVVYRIASEAKATPPSFDEEWNGWSNTQKELRILDTLEPIVQSHRLVVDRSLIERDLLVGRDKTQYSFIQQFTRMARIKGCLPHEDRLEALSMACSYWVERMRVDKDRALENHQVEQKMQMARDFVKGIVTPRSMIGIPAGSVDPYPYRWTRTR